MPGLLTLPNELLYMIASHLPHAPDLASLVLCNRYLAILCAPLLLRMKQALLTAPDTPYFAASRGHVPLLQLLLANTKTPLASHYTAVLHAAARYNQPGIINLLLSYGACVDHLEFSGYTPLHNAVCMGGIDATIALLEAGADINACTYDHRSHHSLNLAMREPFVDIVELLIRCGAWLWPLPYLERCSAPKDRREFALEAAIDIIERENEELGALNAVFETPWPPIELWSPDGEADMIIPWWFELHDEGGMGWELRYWAGKPKWLA